MMARAFMPWILMSLLCVCVTAARWQAHSQIQKTAFSGGANGIGWQPMPTAAAVLIQKRQFSYGPNTCGYLDGDTASSLTSVSSTDTCVSNTALSAIGCCNTASVGPSSFTYTQCVFHTGCLDFAEATNAPANSLVRTCSSDKPNCQTINYLAGAADNLFTDFICGNTSSIRLLQTFASPFLTPSQSLPTLTGIPTTTLLTTNSPSPTTIPSPQSLPSHGLSTGSIVGIVIGSVLSLLVLLVLLFCCCCNLDFRAKEQKDDEMPVSQSPAYHSAYEKTEPRPYENIMPEPPLMQNTTDFIVMEKKNSFGLLLSPDILSLHDYLARFPANGEVLGAFLKFLSSYDYDGVPLRELLMMGALRYPGKQDDSSCPPWDGFEGLFYRGNEIIRDSFRFRGIAPDSIRMTSYVNTQSHVMLIRGLNKDDQSSFLSELVLQAKQEKNLDHVEQRLVELGLIRVSRSAEHNVIENDGWAIDTRIWYICYSSLYSVHDQLGETQRLAYRHIIGIFHQMPDKTSHPLAERHREIYYYHAHAFLWRALDEKLSRNRIMYSTYRESLLCLLLKTLTHRYQQDDILLLETARELLPESDFYIYEWVLLQIAELKHLAHLQESCSFREPEKIILGALMMQMKRFLEQPKIEIPAQLSKSAEARDVAGFFLIEMMDLAQSLQDYDLLNTTSNVCLEWIEQTLDLVSPSSSNSWTHLKISPLSCMLVRLENFEQVKFAALEEFHLSYGYHASRAGLLRHAEDLLIAGLGESKTKDWRYGYELITVYLRQGRWEDAGKLTTKWSERHSESLRGEPFRTAEDLYEYRLTGDPGERGLTNVCLMADRWATSQQFSIAERLLKDSLSSVKNMRDHFTRTTRVAIQLRLLNVQLQLTLPGTIADTCQSLFSEIHSPETFPLESEVVESIIQELLACISRLRNAGHVMEARSILASMLLSERGILEDKFEELYAYMYRMRAEIFSEIGWERGSEGLKTPTRTAGKSSEDEILPIENPMPVGHFRTSKTLNEAKKSESEAPPNQSTETDMTGSTVVPTNVQPTSQTAASSQPADPKVKKVGRLRPLPFFSQNKTFAKVRTPLSSQAMCNMRHLKELSPPTSNPSTVVEEKAPETIAES